VYMFENGTADTKITFEAAEAKNNRFFLDSIRVYQVLPNIPMIIAPATLSMATVQGTPVSGEVTVKGKLLDEDVTVTCPSDNFSVSPATLAKEDVMGEGAKLTVTFNGNKAADTVELTLTSGELTKTIEVTATATPVVEVENIAALRAGEQNTLYKVKGEVVVTAVDGISTWVQDASAAIQIYGATGNTYAVGDGITGIFGTLSDYHGLIELTPGGNQPEATTHDNVVEPEVMTVEELNEKGAEYSSRLIRINGLLLNETEGTWSSNSNTTYTATDEAGNEIIIRTILTKGSYVGEALPENKFDLIAIAGYRDGDVQVSPRVKEDIIEKEVNPCDAPTRLKATVADKSVTLTWN
ncbi:MAG: hypothetical protein K2M92_01780, partial [Bacteroidales bacterium]|nr:hypothetical protein [Bacteroidales bacterium]